MIFSVYSSYLGATLLVIEYVEIFLPPLSLKSLLSARSLENVTVFTGVFTAVAILTGMIPSVEFH